MALVNAVEALVDILTEEAVAREPRVALALVPIVQVLAGRLWMAQMGPLFALVDPLTAAAVPDVSVLAGALVAAHGVRTHRVLVAVVDPLGALVDGWFGRTQDQLVARSSALESHRGTPQWDR